LTKGIHIVNLKKQNIICHRSKLYSIFNMSSYRKPEIQNCLPKISKDCFQLNSDQQSLTTFNCICKRKGN